MTENQSLSNSLILYQKKFNNFSPKELWNKCHLIALVNNSYILKNNFEEIEKRILETKNIKITLEISRNSASSRETRKLILDSADGKNSFIMNDLELNSTNNFNVDSELVKKVFKLFDLTAKNIKKIKRLEKLLINEVNQYESYLKEVII